MSISIGTTRCGLAAHRARIAEIAITFGTSDFVEDLDYIYQGLNMDARNELRTQRVFDPAMQLNASKAGMVVANGCSELGSYHQQVDVKV